MTVSTTTRKVSYTGTGANTVLSTVFPFFAAADLEVQQRVTATGVVTTLVLGVHYSVALASELPGVGTVTPLNGAVDFTAAMTWTIVRTTGITQDMDYVENDAFPAESHEGALDQLTIIAQENRETAERALRFPVTDDSALDPTLPSSVDRASMLLGFDALGEPAALLATTISPSTVLMSVLGKEIAQIGSKTALQTLLGYVRGGLGVKLIDAGLLSARPVPSAVGEGGSATLLFRDDFEDGTLDAWYNVSECNTISAAEHYSGAFGLKYDSSLNPSGGLSIQLAPCQQIFVRYRWKPMATFNPGEAGVHFTRVSLHTDLPPARQLDIGSYSPPTNDVQFRSQWNDSEDINNEFMLTATMAGITIGDWNLVEFFFKLNDNGIENGELQCWLNGVEQFHLTGVPFRDSNDPIAAFFLNTNYDFAPIVMYYDDVEIWDEIPAAGLGGPSLYYATDERAFYYNNGTAWSDRLSLAEVGLFANLPTTLGEIGVASDRLQLYVGSGAAAVPVRSLPPRYLSGFQMSRTGNDELTIGAGSCRNVLFTGAGNAADQLNLIRTSSLAKNASAAWVAGAGGGMLPAAVAYAAGWYHVFAIGKSDGTVDFALDTDVGATAILADVAISATYSWARRIGSILVSAAANIVDFVQSGDTFLWKDPSALTLDASLGNGDYTAGGTVSLVNVPPSVVVQAILNVAVAGGSGPGFILSSGLTSSVVPSATASPLYNVDGHNPGATRHHHFTDGANPPLMRYRALTDNSMSLYILAVGWVDNRGRDY